MSKIVSLVFFHKHFALALKKPTNFDTLLNKEADLNQYIYNMDGIS